MSELNFIDIYWPDPDELTSAQIAAARARLAAEVLRFDPEIDTRPNTPFGDLHLNNLARLLAADEVGHARFMSDLDLENVANGIIWNCDFVRAYLKNFAVVDQATLQSSGVVRLTFNADQAYTVDRRARYQFGGDTFSLRLPYPGPLELYPVGTTPPSNTNCRVLTQVDESAWAVDVAVVGTMTTQVESGAAGATDYPIAELTAIVAQYDFESGLPPSGLPELARMARETHYAASLTARGPAARYLKKNFPDLRVVSPVMTGDAEMVRDVANPLGVGAGYVDAHIQSSGHAGADSHYLTLRYYPEEGHYIGELDLVNPPQRILSMVSAAEAGVPLGLGTAAVDIYSASTNPADAPLAQAAYTVYEKLWVAVAMPRDTAGEPRLTNTLDADGNETHRFLVTYEADPMLPVVTDDILSPSVRPQGVNVLVRGLVPVVIDDLLITYTRAPGVTMKLDAAKANILAYLRALGYPEVYSDSRVGDEMFYAGASDLVSVTCAAHVQWSVASKFLKVPATDPRGGLAAADAVSVTAAAITISSSKGLIPSYQDPHLGTASQTYCSVGPRNVGYIIADDALRFSEITR